MTREELKSFLLSLHPTVAFDAGGEFLNANVTPPEWLPFAQALRYHTELHFDYLFCLTCVDWKTHLTMVYHLHSTIFGHAIVVKAKLDREKPEIESVAEIWKTANFHEREVFELFGVDFLNHPDLRILILPDDWTGGFPLRKDYEDPVNMIKL